MCPKGFNPFQNNVKTRKFNITTSAAKGSKLGGVFAFNFMGESFYFNANASHWTASQMTKSLENLKGIGTVGVDRAVVDSSFGTTYTVEILTWPDYPYQNNVYEHDGNPALSTMSCGLTHVTSGKNVSCMVTDVQVDGIRGKVIEYKCIHMYIDLHLPLSII